MLSSKKMNQEKLDVTNPASGEGEPNLLPSMNEEFWPQLVDTGNENFNAHENKPSHHSKEEDAHTESSGEWETLSIPTTNKAAVDTQSASKDDTLQQEPDNPKKKFLHRCASTPEFSNLEDEDSYVLDCSTDSIDAHSLPFVDDTVLISHSAKSSMKKVPSFKDIIMLNAQTHQDVEKKKKEHIQQHQEKMRNLAMQRRKANKPKLVVNAIKRCAKSTGDLRSLVIHESPEDEYYGGGGGGIVDDVIHEEEVLGETDAMEFYSRKSKGSLSRQNGAKIRPDEAKRKEMILYKKNAQRMAQQDRSD